MSASEKTNTLVMLDLDGTLIDTSPLYFQGLPPIVKRHLGISVTGKEILPMWGQFARNFFVYYAAMAGQQDEALVDTMYAEFCRFYNEKHNELAVAYEGVCEWLPRIHAAVHAVVVVTTRPSSRSVPVLKMPWAVEVDGFVWGDQVDRMKPYPDGLEFAIQQYGEDGCTSVYLGDNSHDIKAARVARPKTVGAAALWDAMDRESLLGSGPDRSFETFQAFSEWVIQERL